MPTVNLGSTMNAELVAPCGMNCNICSAYLAYSSGLPKKRGKISHCQGCLPRRKNCAFLKRRCERIRDGKIRFCHECPSFPCRNLEGIDSRYRKNYGVSLIGNLMDIKKDGVDRFLREQEGAFRCGKCGGTKSIHNGKCYACEEITSWKG
jgi:hypothetical protein